MASGRGRNTVDKVTDFNFRVLLAKGRSAPFYNPHLEEITS